MKYIQILLFIFSLSFSFLAIAQRPAGMQKGNFQGGMKMPAIGRVYGKIVDSRSKGVEYATVTLLLANKDSVITGALTKSNGDFSLDKIPFGRYRVRVQFMGFKTSFHPVTINPNNIEQDIGNIKLLPDSKVIDDVTITDTRPTVIMGVDRRIYNVDKDISSKGGTAADVMKNIPGLTVDADGNVSLRNHSPTIFIDGRPTFLTLEQIPSDQIDRVEVITNPSAKYDASASGGIVNVVMKKSDKPGYNGTLGLNAGTVKFDDLNRVGINGNLNIKEKSFNFFISYNLHYNSNPTKGYTYRTNLDKGIETGEYNQNNLSTSVRNMQSGRVGFDYTVSNRNTLTLAQNIHGGGYSTDDNQNFSQLDASHYLLTSGDRYNQQKNKMQNYTSQVMWKHTYPKQGKDWVADLNYNLGKSSSNADFTTNNYSNTGVILPNNPQLQSNVGSGNNQMYSFQFDYTNPLTDTAKFEFGVKSNYKVSRTGMDVTQFNYPANEFVKDTFLSSDYQIYDLTNALYVNYTNMLWGIGYQAGVRFEQTRFTGSLLNKGLDFSYLYPDGMSNLSKAFFPSLYLSKKIKTSHEVQLNFSRKINRPGWMQVIPYIMFSDKNNIQIGNPALAPEFINLAEMNYNYVFGFGNLLTSAYFRYQENPITQYAYRSTTDSNVLVSTFINGTSNISYGWENTLKLLFFNKKLDISMNGNIFYSKIQATANNNSFENSGVSWNAKGMASYKLPKQFTVQVNGGYEAPRIIAQGKTKEVYSVDVSLNKDVTKKLSFSITLNDVFDTRRFGSYYTTEYFTQDLSRRRDTRFLRVGVSYRFGEWDVSLFKRKSNKRSTDPGMEQGDF